MKHITSNTVMSNNLITIDGYYINKLSQIFTSHDVCKSHGIEHAIAVYNHAQKAIIEEKSISQLEKMAVLMASLLHDADDRKFFPNNLNNENTRDILKGKSDTFINLVTTMINLVSSVQNKDNIPLNVKNNLWMLIPRYSDRLEAIGEIGIIRCYQYNNTIQRPLFTEKTPFAKTKYEIDTIATQERYNNYVGNSESMIDHYYDKILRSHLFPINNNYLLNEATLRQEYIINFIIKFGNTQMIDENEIIKLALKYNIKI